MHELPAALLFSLIAPPVLFSLEDGNAVIIVALACAVISIVQQQSATAEQALSAAGLACILILDRNPWYMAITWLPVALLCTAALATVYTEVHRKNDKHAVRTLAYVLAMVACTIVGLLYVRKLVQLFEDDSTLTPALSTTRNCTDEPDGDGIIFEEESFATCPTRVWKYLRINTILLTQVYVLYTLTTAMRHERAPSVHSVPRAMSFAVIECILWSAAAVGQFDKIAKCYIMSTTTLVFLMSAAVLRTARYMTHESSPDVHIAESGSVTWSHLHSRRLKLKL
jgi:hypothetical protein